LTTLEYEAIVSDMDYKHRVVDEELAEDLRGAGAVLIEGPKACGKTATARQISASEVRLDIDKPAREAAKTDPEIILEGDRPRLIDEWQRVPEVWDHVRAHVDDDPGRGQFILTGSAVPPRSAPRHPGPGRFDRLRMRPMTLFEAGYSPGGVSFRAVLSGEDISTTDTGMSIKRIAELISIGGWPGNLDLDLDAARRMVRGYVDQVATTDVPQLDDAERDARGRRPDPHAVSRLFRSLARNVSTAASTATLTKDVNGRDGKLKEETVSGHLDALARLFVTEDLSAWSPSLRSRTRLREAEVRHFADPSLAVAALRTTPAALLRDVEWLGLLFEDLVVRDLRVYAQAIGADVLSYRDKTGLEADAIIETTDGWAAFEVKLGVNAIDAAADSLLALRDRVDTKIVGEPLALAVVTGKGPGYRRKDGVAVVPIGALMP
jgi:predicted AAA+ superfamily ATPase